jgi:hypothetical protein
MDGRRANLGVRACGHVAHIRVRQHGGGGGHGDRRDLLAPHAVRHGRRCREEKRDGERANRWTPHVSGCDCVLGGRRASWAERSDGPLGLLAGGEKRRWSGELQELG